MSLLTEEDARALASISADPARAAQSDGYRRGAMFHRALKRIQCATSALHLYVGEPSEGNHRDMLAPSLETLRKTREALRLQLTARGFPPQMLASFLETERALLEKGREQMQHRARARGQAILGIDAWDTELCVVGQLLRDMSPPR